MSDRWFDEDMNPMTEEEMFARQDKMAVEAYKAELLKKIDSEGFGYDMAIERIKEIIKGEK